MRHITTDPIGLEGGLNTFGYASANPLQLKDSSGLKVEPDDKTFIEESLSLGITEPLGVWRPWVFGQRIHAMFTAAVAKDGYTPFTFGNGLKADAFRRMCGSIYELKPPSYRSGGNYNSAIRQIESYIEAANSQFGRGKAGDYKDIFKNSSDVYLGSLSWAGSVYDVRMSPGASGLVFYDKTKSSGLLDRVWGDLPSGTLLPHFPQPGDDREGKGVVIILP